MKIAQKIYHYSVKKFTQFDVNASGGESNYTYGEGIFFMTRTPISKPLIPEFLNRHYSKIFYIYRCNLNPESIILDATIQKFDQQILNKTLQRAGLIKKIELMIFLKFKKKPSWQFLVATHKKSILLTIIKKESSKICRQEDGTFCQNAKELGIDIIQNPHVNYIITWRSIELENWNQNQYETTMLVLNPSIINIIKRTIHKN